MIKDSGTYLQTTRIPLPERDCWLSWPHIKVPYFFGYKTEFLFFQNNPKDLDLSCKTDLDLLDCLGRVNLVL